MDARHREQVEQLHRSLLERIEAVQSGDDWKRLLDFASRFHRYSADNQQLIAMAHEDAYRGGRVPDPSPTYVAGFRTWKALGRTVDKGQRGYPILAPAPYRDRAARTSDGTMRSLDPGEHIAETEELVRGPARLRGFTVAYVWDLSQTSGAPIPEQGRPELLLGAAPAGLHTQLTDFLFAREFTVRDVAGPEAIGGANGRTNFTSRTVSIRRDMDDAARVKTLIHETGHVLLHDPTGDVDLAAQGAAHRGRAEVEAESVAYVIAAAHGLDTSGYSVPYVTHWAGIDAPPEMVRDTAKRVVAACRQILDGLDTDHGLGGQSPGVQQTMARTTAARQARLMTANQYTAPSVPAIGA